MIESTANVVLLACIVPVHVLLYYLTRVPWWESDLGRGLFGLKFALAAILDLALVRVIVGGDHPWFAVLRLVVFCVAFVALITQARAFRRILLEAAITRPDATHLEDA